MYVSSIQIKKQDMIVPQKAPTYLLPGSRLSGGNHYLHFQHLILVGPVYDVRVHGTRQLNLWYGFCSTLSLWNSFSLLCVVIICLHLFPIVFNYITISHSCICFTLDEPLGLLWTFVCVSFGKYMCAYLLNVYLGMKSLGHGVYI